MSVTEQTIKTEDIKQQVADLSDREREIYEEFHKALVRSAEENKRNPKWKERVTEEEILNLARIKARAEEFGKIDSKTGLFNDEAFTEAYNNALECLRPEDSILVVWIDFNDFKTINDLSEGGHGDGDRVLKDVAQAIQGSIRVGEIAGRLGGDEFAFFLKVGDEDNIDVLAQKIESIQSKIRKIKRPDNQQEVTVSAGMVRVRYGNKLFIGDALRKADEAARITKEEKGTSVTVMSGKNNAYATFQRAYTPDGQVIAMPTESGGDYLDRDVRKDASWHAFESMPLKRAWIYIKKWWKDPDINRNLTLDKYIAQQYDAKQYPNLNMETEIFPLFHQAKINEREYMRAQRKTQE